MLTLIRIVFCYLTEQLCFEPNRTRVERTELNVQGKTNLRTLGTGTNHKTIDKSNLQPSSLPFWVQRKED